MPVYRVIDNESEKTVYAYASTAPFPFPEYPFSQFSHIEEISVIDGAVVDTPGVIRTKLEHLRRFTQDERVAIRNAAKAIPVLEDYMALLELAEEINITDPDTIAAVQMLETSGLLAVGRASEILS